jgi:Acyl-coenzyme A:6-aminopenicillanic acid acyl-transferase
MDAGNVDRNLGRAYYMNRHFGFPDNIPSMSLGFALLMFLLAPLSIKACTIFTLTDTSRTLFCNNEDYDTPQTRIWFIPGNHEQYGRVFVGFNNWWGQGGMNSAGLAYDWVAGYNETWKRDPRMKSSSVANPSEQMLATCATIEEAIAFFKSHWDPQLSYAKALIADRTGASVIIGAKNGQLDIEILKQSRGFGFGGEIVDKMLAEKPGPTLANAASILKLARQDGQYATKYSNVFDLKSGDIFLFHIRGQPETVKLNLERELKKGRHFYGIPNITEELAHRLDPAIAKQLTDRRKRFLNQTPAARAELTLRHLVRTLSTETPDYSHMSPALAADLRGGAEQGRALLAKLGALNALSYKGTEEDGTDVYDGIFSSGTEEFQLLLQEDGTVESVVFVQTPQSPK